MKKKYSLKRRLLREMSQGAAANQAVGEIAGEQDDQLLFPDDTGSDEQEYDAALQDAGLTDEDVISTEGEGISLVFTDQFFGDDGDDGEEEEL